MPSQNSTVPILVAVYPGPFESHLVLTHVSNMTFSGDLFYVGPGTPSIAPFLVPRISGTTANFVPGAGGGLALSGGFWGDDVDTLVGSTVKERAEVWYDHH